MCAILRNEAERHVLKRKHSEAAMIGALERVEAGPTAADVASERLHKGTSPIARPPLSFRVFHFGR